jgi:hypothetical protein
MQAAILTGATALSAGLVGVLTDLAPIALGVMVGILAVRVVVKVFNRVIGK